MINVRLVGRVEMRQWFFELLNTIPHKIEGRPLLPVGPVYKFDDSLVRLVIRSRTSPTSKLTLNCGHFGTYYDEHFDKASEKMASFFFEKFDV